MRCCAYLDIETTSLSPADGDLTVIGVCVERDGVQRLTQLVGDGISAGRFQEIMEGVEVLYTYNGSQFDLPFIKAKLGVDFSGCCQHLDLMYACWRNKLYGGLKEVERRLGIGRNLKDLNGRMAAQLWRDYQQFGEPRLLSTLLAYNREDVLNLIVLREKLKV